jgi:hypothetical protein
MLITDVTKHCIVQYLLQVLSFDNVILSEAEGSNNNDEILRLRSGRLQNESYSTTD